MNDSVKSVSQERRWFDNLNKALKYYLKNGFYPKTNDKENGGTWLANQRFYFKENNGALSFDRIKILDERLPGWNLPLSERRKGYVAKEDENVRWMRLFGKVKKYYDNVLIFPVFNDQKNGGTWLVTQRNDYKNGVLDIDKKKLLDDDLPNWNVDLSFDEFEMNNWYRHLLLVKNYYLKNGKFPYAKCLEDGSNWLNGQRKIFRNGNLSLDKIAILDRELPGWADVAIAYESLDEKWMKSFEIVKNYYNKYGTFPATDDHKNSGRWLYHQRRFLKANKLDVKKKQLLDNELPNWFSYSKTKENHDKMWYEKYLIVKEYCIKHGNRPLFTDKENGGYWLQMQRIAFLNGDLSLEKIKLLDECIPNWKSGRVSRYDDTNWLEQLLRVKKYYLEHGFYPIHTDKENGGSWLVNQRQFLKRNKLREDRKNILDAILPNWEVGIYNKKADDEGWNIQLLKVKKYYDDNKCYPNQNDLENGGDWLYRQHRGLLDGKLKDYRKQILDKILPGWNFYRKRVRRIKTNPNFEILHSKNDVKIRIKKD